MEENSERSDSDSIDVRVRYRNKVKYPENTDPAKIAVNRLILHDLSEHPELWDRNHEAYNPVAPGPALRMIEERHNLEPGELMSKWRKISKYYKVIVEDYKLSIVDDEIPSSENYAHIFPFFQEIKFYNPILKDMLETKSEKRRHSDDEENALLNEESSSQSVSLTTGCGSHHDTDSQDSSKLRSQLDTDSQDSSQSKPLLENLDRGTQTSSSPNVSQSSDYVQNNLPLNNLIKLHTRLNPRQKLRLSQRVEHLIRDFENSPSSSEDSSAAQ